MASSLHQEALYESEKVVLKNTNSILALSAAATVLNRLFSSHAVAQATAFSNSWTFADGQHPANG